MVQAADEGLNAMQARSTQPTGRLRLTVPSGGQHPCYSSGLADFVKRYPGISLSIHHTDALVDLAGSEFDLAIRGSLTGLDDSSYKARHLYSEEVWLTAAPDYLKDRSPPRSIDDLAGWNWIEFAPGLYFERFLPGQDRAGSAVGLRTAITVDSMVVAETLALAGVGLLSVPRGVVEPHVQSCRLFRLLPKLALLPIESYAIWPAKAGPSSPVRLLLDYLIQHAKLHLN